MNNKQGFTLIEMIVVIGILGILAVISINGVTNLRMNARDAQRIADLQQIRIALQKFYEDNGYYPRSNCGWDCNGYNLSYASSWTNFSNDLAPYLSPLPVDPVNSTCAPWNSSQKCYTYAYGNVGRYTRGHTYDLTTRLENPNNSERCEIKGWRFYFDDRYWCTAFGGNYNNYIYEASPR